MSQYFARTPFTGHWRFEARPEDDPVAPFALRYFPRSLSDYLDTAAGAGFRIVCTEEPRPDEAAIAGLRVCPAGGTTADFC